MRSCVNTTADGKGLKEDHAAFSFARASGAESRHAALVESDSYPIARYMLPMPTSPEGLHSDAQEGTSRSHEFVLKQHCALCVTVSLLSCRFLLIYPGKEEPTSHSEHQLANCP